MSRVPLENQALTARTSCGVMPLRPWFLVDLQVRCQRLQGQGRAFHLPQFSVAFVIFTLMSASVIDSVFWLFDYVFSTGITPHHY